MNPSLCQDNNFSPKPKVFLVIKIASHLPIMIQTAKLLLESGKYQPVFIYQTHQLVQNNQVQDNNLSCSEWFFYLDHFIEKNDFFSIFLIESDEYFNAPLLLRFLNYGFWFPNKGIYRKIFQTIKFLPKPQTVAFFLRKTSSLFIKIIRWFEFVRRLVKLFSIEISSLLRPLKNEPKHAHKTWVQRCLLHAFAQKWGGLKEKPQLKKKNIRSLFSHLIDKICASELKEQKRFSYAFEKILEEIDPSLVILPEENLFYDSPWIVHLAHARHIPVAVVPFTIVNTLEWRRPFITTTAIRPIVVGILFFLKLFLTGFCNTGEND